MSPDRKIIAARTRNPNRVQHYFKPPGQIQKPISPDIINNIINLLTKYSSIPLENFLQTYYYSFNKLLDPDKDLGCSCGLSSAAGIFSREGILFDDTGETLKLKLRKDVAQGSKIRPTDFAHGAIFDPKFGKLWFGDSLDFLQSDRKLIIEKSPLELAMIRNRDKVEEAQKLFTNYFKFKPEGIKLTHMSSLMGTVIDKHLFNVSNFIELVQHYPEIYLKVERRIEVEGFRAVREDIIYDGNKYTYKNIPDHIFDFNITDSAALALSAIRSGVYAKTLLLVRAAGRAGLKIHVWAESMKKNFKFHTESACNIIKTNPIEFFFKLEHQGLINVESIGARNDLRAFVPLNLDQYFTKVFNELDRTVHLRTRIPFLELYNHH